MAGFDVDELEADSLGESGGADVVVDQLVEVVVGPDDRVVVRVDAELGVEERVVVGDPRLELVLVVGFAEAAGVGELEADEEVVDRAEGGAGGRR